MARKYFGTDGIRGLVGAAPITPDFVMRLGYAAGTVLVKGKKSSSGRPVVLIGKDTRISGYMLEAVQDSDCGLCVMHMQATPATMQQAPRYDDVVGDVIAFLQARVDAMTASGIERSRICVDPGFGFGKTVEHNYALLRGLGRIRDELGLPVLAGMSRKSMIGAVTGRPVEQRTAGSVGAALAAVAQGARIVRVHDVAETVDALKVWHAAMHP